jgi:hypothetical protein
MLQGAHILTNVRTQAKYGDDGETKPQNEPLLQVRCLWLE